MRLIDADALKEKIIKERDAIPTMVVERYSFGCRVPYPHGMSMRGGIKKALRCMEETPTIDAVPVVRCKDCALCKVDNSVYMKDVFGNENDTPQYLCLIGYGYNKPDHFCSYGERRNDG